MKPNEYFIKCGELAQRAMCLRARCGALIVNNEEIIGEGYNAPPQDDVSQQKCKEIDALLPKDKSKYDRTCCVHAEWRAIVDALKRNPKKIKDATLYFVRIDDEENIKPSGKPFCTVCSRLALDVGLKAFALIHKDGPQLYDTTAYNNLSYQYFDS